jgi:predicted HTH domain antitoxin
MLTIPVSEDILHAVDMTEDELAAYMSREYAVKLFREEKLTLAQSARLCGMDTFSFLDVLAVAGVPVADYGEAELEKELAYFK